jgi:hypothetical protein
MIGARTPSPTTTAGATRRRAKGIGLGSPRSDRVELEDASPLGRFHWTPDIDPIHELDEPDAERDAARNGAKGVAEERDSLRRVQLGRPDLFLAARGRSPRTYRGRSADLIDDNAYET